LNPAFLSSPQPLNRSTNQLRLQLGLNRCESADCRLKGRNPDSNSYERERAEEQRQHIFSTAAQRGWKFRLPDYT
jgi:hypothetical protein